MHIPIVNHSNNPLPAYATLGAAGMDIRAFLEEPLTVAPFERVLVPTGIHIALPMGYEAQLRMRSGISYRQGLIMPNAPATIDCDYRGELKVIVANISNEEQIIQPGERIAQMVIARYERITWTETDSLDETERGTGGFGSTGKS